MLQIIIKVTVNNLGSVWSISVVNGNERLKDNEGVKLHSTQKPEELLYKIINISSKINDIVLDPFAGTMTTGKVAKQTGRKYIMIGTGWKILSLWCKQNRKNHRKNRRYWISNLWHKALKSRPKRHDRWMAFYTLESSFI